MLTEERISRFYEDVKKLGLKRPVAAITKATGFSKGNVSTYLSKKAPPSENFIDKFYEVFKESFKKVPHGTLKVTDKGQEKTLGRVPAEELIQVLKEHNEFLRRNFELSLAGISVQAASILAYVSTSLELDNERAAAGDADKLQQLKSDTGRRIGEKMVVGQKMDMKTVNK